jgi:hypothetical protein
MESAEEKPTGTRPTSPEEAARQRERESLRLARSRVMQQLEVAHEPRYIKLLNDALEDLNSRLAKLQ